MLAPMRVESDMNAQPADHPAIEPHVLAVDDDPIIREMITDYLVKHELRVTAVADGRSMAQVLAAEVVDLIVLDLKLRSEDGMSLARNLRDESAIPSNSARTTTSPSRSARASSWHASARCFAVAMPKCARGVPKESAPTDSMAGS
jgi:CheY-like chemotaxis protein